MADSRASKYSEWIAENRPDDPWGTCEGVTRRMAEAFPELRRVRGHYVCPVQGRLPHWWMLAPDGQVIDPTRDQFASPEDGAYEEHVGPEPTGRCLNCDALLYGDARVCNDDCAREFIALVLEENS